MTRHRQSKLKERLRAARGSASDPSLEKKKGIRPNSQTLELLPNVKLLYDKNIELSADLMIKDIYNDII